jgi:hypothetical protein
MIRWACVLLAAVVLTVTGSGVGFAGLRNAWFSNGAMVQGQTVRSEGELPGETKVFESDKDKVARMFFVFGDRDAHALRGDLKAADGKTVRKLNYDLPALNRAGTGTWRYAARSFNLEGLAPGVYTIDLIVDDGKVGTYSFTLK